jgi:hypothetical protein
MVLVKTDYPWQEPYAAAVVETKFEKLFPLVREAKAAIDTRLHELQMDHGGTPEERLAISDALAGLNALRRAIEIGSQRNDLVARPFFLTLQANS